MRSLAQLVGVRSCPVPAAVVFTKFPGTLGTRKNQEECDGCQHRRRQIRVVDPVDAMDEASIYALVEAAVKTYGALHIMCNHVGGSNPRKDLDFLRLDMDEFDRTMRLNVRSTVVGSRAALPHIIAAGGGSIINTASVDGLSANFLQIAYGTAKAAVIRMSEYIATQ